MMELTGTSVTRGEAERGEEDKVQGDILQLYKYLEDCVNEKEPNFSVVSSDKRQLKYTEIHGNNAKQKKKGFYSEGCQTMEWVAQRSCGVPVLGDTETCLNTALDNIFLCMSG